MKRLRLVKIWLMVASRAAQSWLITDWSGPLFLAGKIVRFLMFFVFLFTVLSSSQTLAGFSREQVIFFFLVFNLIDVMVQFFFRGVYLFRSQVVSGDFDLDLSKPLPSFFRPIFGWTDIYDLITLVPLWFFFAWFTFKNQLFISLENLFVFLILLINSLILAFAFHLFVCAVCVMTTEIDHLIMVYRDLTGMARFPTDIYGKAIQYLLTFTIPVIVLITVPAKALIGLLSWQWVVFSFVISGLFLFLSIRFWRYALTQYSSASS
jgi:ABC-2 type transport system permease protein